MGGGASSAKSSSAHKKLANQLHKQATAHRESAGRAMAQGHAYAAAGRWDDAARHYGYAGEEYAAGAASDAEGAYHDVAGGVLEGLGL